MKKLSVIIAVLALVTLTSCTKDENGTENTEIEILSPDKKDVNPPGN